jgi:hypothetical protein
MTDEGRRDELPLQCGDAEIGERRDDSTPNSSFTRTPDMEAFSSITRAS